jgi:hypothetical protein
MRQWWSGPSKLREAHHRPLNQVAQAAAGTPRAMTSGTTCSTNLQQQHAAGAHGKPCWHGQRLRALELFSGIGGFHSSLSRVLGATGGRLVADVTAVDIDQARNTRDDAVQA